MSPPQHQTAPSLATTFTARANVFILPQLAIVGAQHVISGIIGVFNEVNFTPDLTPSVLSHALRFSGEVFHICVAQTSNALPPVLLRQGTRICTSDLLAECKVLVGSYVVMSDVKYGGARPCYALCDRRHNLDYYSGIYV